MADSNHVDVVLVADVNDPHHRAVNTHLQALGARTHLNLSDVTAMPLVSRTWALDIAVGATWLRVDHDTTVWWFRPGSVRPEIGMEADEAQLIADEVSAVFVGSFRSAEVRWVDDPEVIRRAECKQHQLTVATDLRVDTPRWTVTNSAAAAQRFANGNPMIAKPLSSGIGIAPYTDAVSVEDLAELGDLQTLLQLRVEAMADLRVVVIDGQTWVWRRAREPDTIDWRAIDPQGRGFSLLSQDNLGAAPSRITSALGLSMSVQDWLETSHGPIFLETNPQGSWAFLNGADSIVGAALAEHLVKRTRESDGTWP